jgi:hypothetical protein
LEARLGSIAALVMQCVPLAESQILKAAGELRLLVDQARRGAGGTAGENNGTKSQRKNDRLNLHGNLLNEINVAGTSDVPQSAIRYTARHAR